MIRNRRDEDFDRLCDILGELDDHAGVIAERRPRGWLQEVDADRSWVFDQAPVRVTPTGNVVGHVQIYQSSDASWVCHVATQLSRRADDLLVIGRLFVRPGKHDYGIARYLLTESVKYVEKQGCLPVLDPLDLLFLPASLCAKLGFKELPTEDGLRSAIARTQ